MNKTRYMILFMHVVSSGSITKAAIKLDVSKSVVSHQLKLLEQELGVTLLKRTTRKQQLTSAGQAFYQHCIQLHHISETAWQDAKDALEEPQGTLKISAPHALMSSLIVPALHVAFKGYDRLSLDLISNDDQQDLMHEDIDLAIRIGLSKTSNLKQQRLGSFRDQLCQSAKHALIKDQGAADLEIQPYISNTWQGKHIQHEFLSIKNNDVLRLNFETTHNANNLQTCISLIEQGFGIGIVPDFICKQYKASLTPLLSAFQLQESPIYAIHPYQDNTPISVIMAIKHIKKALAKL